MLETTCGNVGTKPALNALDRDVRRLAGYEITKEPLVRDQGSYLVIRGKKTGPNGLPVVMKVPRSSARVGFELAGREFTFLDTVQQATPYVPQVVDYTTVFLATDTFGVGRKATATSRHVEEFPLLVMEEIPGPNFQQRIETEGPLSARLLFESLLSVALALDAFGTVGVVHRDVKPGNIVGGRVVDLELAVTDSEKVNKNGFALGTFGYASPEQFVTPIVLKPASDQFSFGVTLFEAYRNKSFLPVVDIERTKTLYANQGEFERHLDEMFEDSQVPMPEQEVFRRTNAFHPRNRFGSCTQALVEFERSTQLSDSVYI